MSIISFDNIFLSRIVDPKLTTMDQNMFKLGYTTATILSMNKVVDKTITLENILIERETTGYCKV
ncbi:MAG: LacI family DNA-binding transcriptional regulator [Selenomonadaceae bacterium]|nr:LacI family DNA-binding transcriptional regulator [Selenomonadaceae bacterium]